MYSLVNQSESDSSIQSQRVDLWKWGVLMFGSYLDIKFILDLKQLFSIQFLGFEFHLHHVNPSHVKHVR